VAVKIKLKRMGKIREPHYRIVVADARTKRDGRAIEEIGKYYPKGDPSFIEVDSDRAQHWLSVGAQPTDPVRKLLEVTGDWQRFKGLPGAEGTLKEAAPRTDKKEIFAAALAETLTESTAAPKGRGRAGGKAAEAKAGEAKAAEVKAGGGKAADAKAGDAKAAGAKAGDAKAADAKAADAKAGDAKARDGKAGEGKAKGEKADKPAKAAKSGDAKSRAAKAGGDESSETDASATAEPAPDAEAAAAEPGTGD
jgi:small subunit ribosomal protein S16